MWAEDKASREAPGVQASGLSPANVLPAEHLLADEPSGNLDSENAALLHDLFFELRDRLGQTIVLVTHNEQLAQRADRMLRMADGQFV